MSPEPRLLRACFLSLGVLAALAGQARAHDDIADALRSLADSTQAHGTPLERAWVAAEWLRRDGRLTEADSALRVAEALAPGAASVRAVRAALAIDQGRPEAALAVLDPLLAESPGFSEARWLRARARRVLGDGDGALADFDRALADSRRPTPEAYAERASAALASGDGPRALAGLDEGARRLHAVSLAERAAQLERSLGRLDDALERLEPLAEANPGLRALRARWLAQAGRKLDAQAEWSALLDTLASPGRSTMAVRALVEEARAALTAEEKQP